MNIDLRSLSLSLIAIFLCVQTASAQIGTPDSTFGQDGVLTLDFGQADVICNMQPASDGGLYIFGAYTEDILASDSRIFATKIRADGTTDESFGINGSIRIDSLGLDFVPWEGRVLNNGDVVFVGTNPDFDTVAYARYHSDGSPDLSVGPEGITIALTDYMFKRTNDLSIASDGTTYWCGAHEFALSGTVERIFSDGTQDDQFEIAATISPSYFFLVNGAKIVGDTSLYINGLQVSSTVGTAWSYVKMDTSGNLDTAFGTDGNITFTSFDAAADEYDNDMYFDPVEDRLLSIHTTLMQATDSSTLADSLSGAYINAFSGVGARDSVYSSYQTKPIDHRRSLYTSIVSQTGQEDDILIGGFEGVDSTEEFIPAVRSLRSDGQPDSSFGNNGLYLAEELAFTENILDIPPILPELVIGAEGGIYYAYSFSEALGGANCRVIKLKSELETSVSRPEAKSFEWTIQNPQSDLQWEYQFTKAVQGDCSLRVFDRSGKLFAQKLVNTAHAHSGGSIDLPAGLPAGMYFVLLQTKEGRSVKRVMYQSKR